jgi:hypothetical protein
VALFRLTTGDLELAFPAKFCANGFPGNFPLLPSSSLRSGIYATNSRDRRRAVECECIAGRKSTVRAEAFVENLLDRFDDQWRSECINVASLPDRPAGSASLPDNSVDQQGLRRSSSHSSAAIGSGVAESLVRELLRLGRHRLNAD